MAKVSLFFLFFVVSKGETSVVQTQQTVTAAAGGEAHLSCRLTQPKDVFQVTWQKIVSGSEENIGSYSELYGERVVPRFKEKVLINPGMQNSSIIVRNVSEEDGGCFLCLFSTYSQGTLKGRTCLQVYELHPPVLHVRASDSESVVICSATGRPAPTLTLTVGQQHLNSSHNHTVNHNNTITVTAAAVLSGLGSNSTRVGCSAAVFSGPQLKASLLLHGLDVEPGSVHSRGRLGLIWTGGVVGTGVISALIFYMWRRRSQKRTERPSKTEEEQTIKTVILISHFRNCVFY
ncbi:OX-2 membrane glycoprotein-like [Oryzias latipes]|uniref:Ig-like domain-containing protein n=1 Tax=Oryzias latipes TaxID=8090 RepID=A0A3B3I204_ORYLA|nr:OX-2 membrane glycoprotein-like [Oryzias latipes]